LSGWNNRASRGVKAKKERDPALDPHDKEFEMTKPYFTGVLAVLILLLAACTPMPVTEQPTAQAPAQQTATATEAPAEPTTEPVSQAEITDIVWQWSDLVETMPASQSVVPDPQNYTITFHPDNQVGIKADCNVGGGTYTLDGNSLAIQLGISTMAYCGEQSLDQIYLQALAKVSSASMADGRLILHLGEDAGQMGFKDGGAPEASAADSPAEPAALPATEAQIVNIVWQWSDLVETLPASQSVVPDPQNYTITFMEDGTIGIKADCNVVGGHYTLDEASLSIQLGPSTMAFCGEESLDQQYLALLGQVNTAEMADGRLFLQLVGDAGRMGFEDGGAPQANSTTGPGTTSGLRSTEGMILPQQVSIDTQGLPYGWQANLVPATPYDTSQPPGPVGLPRHIEINFGVTDPASKQPGDPVMYIIPVDEYEQMWDSAGNPYVTNTITGVYSWTVALQSPPPTSGLPALSPEQIAGVNDLAVQIGRAKSDADSASKSGYRFVGRWAQDANPVTAESRLWYTYQGFTNDGKYLVSFWYPVTTTELPKQADMTAAEMDKFNSDPQAYIQAQAEMLNALPPSDWQPDLTQLDNLVGSLRIVGMTATGLPGPVWQWTGTSWYELTESGYVLRENPIADPAQYEVVYTPDGALQVKADCNRASGAYTYDGGMVGSVRVQMGPATMAECGPESRSQELINSLMAAQDYRVQPGGGQLQLNMPAGGPMLHFQGKW
jgi:heat shock protein HslJ